MATTGLGMRNRDPKVWLVFEVRVDGCRQWEEEGIDFEVVNAGFTYVG